MVSLSRVYDVLVIGGGNAALCAAITAREAGASVLLIEWAPKAFRGGNTRHTRNLRAMHSEPTSVLTETYLEDEYWDDLKRVTGGNTNEELARITIRETEGSLPWLEARGVRFQPSLTGTLNLSRTNAFFLGGGKSLVNALFNHAERIGVEVLYDTEATDLVLDDGFVREVKIVSKGFPATVRSKAVVASSGGFQANIEWLKEYWGPPAENFLIRGTPYAKGRVLRSLLDQGVHQIGDPTQCHAVGIDARAPQFDGGIASRLDSVPFSIMLNQNAERFYDEGEDVWPKRYAIWGRLIAQQPGQIGYSIVDAKAEKLFMPSVFPAYRANTIRELAGQLGLDPDKVEKTIKEYNAAVQPGVFDSTKLDGCTTAGITPPKTNWAQKIDTAPFIAYPLRPGITFTYLGVKVDERARVLMGNNVPTANLYASGEIMAGNILSKGYLAGFGMSIGTVFGRIAGREAARRVLN
jgi:tricarballylate dehydrogenase